MGLSLDQRVATAVAFAELLIDEAIFTCGVAVREPDLQAIRSQKPS
jgi:hypothetical protein